MSPRRLRGERGSATLATVGMVGVLLFLGVAFGAVTAVVVAHRAAQSAADLAALAAASSLAEGRSGCTFAAKVAAANDSDLVACRPTGREVTVQVRVIGPRWLGLGADPLATARAGPA